jgi:pyruvate,water dikinase
VDGTTTTTDLNGLVRVRKAEFDNYRVSAAPPDRFETFGIPARGLPARFSRQKLTVAAPTGETLQGLGCSRGMLRGRVRVVTDPKNAVLETGEILVADHTDPGWILLFSNAAGLLVEHGSLLSHAAIVSREMGLPCIVSLPGVTHWLKNGDWVEFDGSTGLVRKLENQ